MASRRRTRYRQKEASEYRDQRGDLDRLIDGEREESAPQTGELVVKCDTFGRTNLERPIHTSQVRRPPPANFRALTQAAFVARRSDTWRRLDALVDRVGRRGTRALSPDEIFELGRLYRATTSDLAYAQGRGYDDSLLEYLNRSVARAHAQVYARAPESSMRRIADFYARVFPQEFRRSLPYVAICTAITAACAVVAYVLVRNHPADAYALLPKALVSENIRKSLHDSNFAVDPSFGPAMSAAIITNNVKVAIIAFAGLDHVRRAYGLHHRYKRADARRDGRALHQCRLRRRFLGDDRAARHHRADRDPDRRARRVC